MYSASRYGLYKPQCDEHTFIDSCPKKIQPPPAAGAADHIIEYILKRSVSYFFFSFASRFLCCGDRDIHANRYCVCFNKSVRCGATCNCEGCLNKLGGRRFEKKNHDPQMHEIRKAAIVGFDGELFLQVFFSSFPIFDSA